MTHLRCLRNGSIPSEMQLYGYNVYTYSLGIDSLPGELRISNFCLSPGIDWVFKKIQFIV